MTERNVSRTRLDGGGVNGSALGRDRAKHCDAISVLFLRPCGLPGIGSALPCPIHAAASKTNHSDFCAKHIGAKQVQVDGVLPSLRR